MNGPPPFRRVLWCALALVVAACGGDSTVSAPDADAPTAGPLPTTSDQEAAAEAEVPPTPSAGPNATPTSPPDPPRPEPSPTPSPSPTAAPTPLTIPDELDLVLTPLVELDRPIDLATRPGSPLLYLATKGGRVVEVSGSSIERTVIDISASITDGAETGLLGITFDPTGELLYLMFSDRNGDNRLVELAFTGDQLDLADARVVLDVPQPRRNHNGGDIVFGPDGLLYIALGDGGGAGDPFGNGQNTDTLLGSILRIDPVGDPYAIPPDNPFADGGGRPEIFLFGARNPWRISFDRETGDLWVADVGQGALEEVDVLYASAGGGRGANLGWNLVEGNRGFASSSPPQDGYVAPIHEYGRQDGCSITGGYVYRGEAIPNLVGSYVFGDYCSGLMWGFASSELQGALGRFDLDVGVGGRGLVSFGEDNDGELYVLSFDGTVYRLDPA